MRILNTYYVENIKLNTENWKIQKSVTVCAFKLRIEVISETELSVEERRCCLLGVCREPVREYLRST